MSRRALMVTMAVLALASADSGRAAPPPSTPSGGYWLLDLAWDQAGNLAQAPTRTDAAELICLLQAATRLEPNLAEAWRQQYDLLNGLGRAAEAGQALARYVALAPDDEPACLAYAALQVSSGQTAEQRLAACNTWLSRKDLPAPVVAFLHRTAAEILLNRLQNQQALQHAQQAVRAFPYDLVAQRLLLDLSGRKGPVADLQIALWAVRRNPADTTALLQVAYLADALGMYSEGGTWYASAREILEKLGQDRTDLSLRLADHWLNAGQPDKAVATLAALTARPHAPAEAWLLLSNAYEMLDKPAEARQAAAAALKAFAPATAPTATSPASQPASQPLSLDARIQADWIRLMYMGETGTALEDAKAALEANPDQLWARRTYGWALLKTNQADAAIRVFSPVAEVDPWSTLGLAQALYSRSDQQSAGDTLRTLQRLSPTGPAWLAAKRWSKQVDLPLPAPEPAQVGQAQTLLADFPKALLRLPLQPSDFLQVKVAMDAPPPAGEPWFGRIQLTNVGNQPIYCGPDGALMPNVLLSAMVYDPAARDIGQRLLLSLHRQMVLGPKQTIALYRPLDTGPLRQALRDPYRTSTVTFTAILDPIRTAGGAWQAGPGGLMAEPVTAERRAGAPASGEDLLRLARSGSPAEKANLARQIACLTIGLANRLPAQTQPAAPSPSLLTEALAMLLQDADPIVAAHALAQADHVPLSDALAKAAAAEVSGDNWLDRLLAIRLFAHKQGAKFTRALGGLGTSDPDPLVRQLAAAYHAAFQAGQKPR